MSMVVDKKQKMRVEIYDLFAMTVTDKANDVEEDDDKNMDPATIDIRLSYKTLNVYLSHTRGPCSHTFPQY